MKMLILLLFAHSAMAQLTIPFGKSGKIRYNLSKGVYDVVVNGKVIIKDVYAGTPEHKSTSLPYLKYTVEQGRYAVHRTSMTQFFYVSPEKPYFLVQVETTGRAAKSSPLTGKISSAGRGLVVPFDNDMWVRYEVKDKLDYTSSEVTAFIDGGLVIGSVEHKVWKSGVHVANGEVSAFGGYTDSITTHDKVQHGKVGNITCTSPKFMVGFFDDWRKGMEAYAAANKIAEPPVIHAWKKATPMGWNSWGVLQTKLNLQNAKSVIDFFADSCKGFRNADNTLYIDLDSYWDNLKENELKEFVAYCKSKQFVPGIYWGPFADWGKRDSSAWIKQNGRPVDLDGAYALDPTHPNTKNRIIKYISRFKEWGFEMIKIDFLGHAALESDHFYQSNITTGMQAYAAGMEFLDSVLDNTMLVYAAISPTMATGRYVHMRRIACDAFHAIDNTEYTLNSTGYGWWQSHLYQYADADHVVFKTEPAHAARARFVSALVTGTLITGDDYSSEGPWRTTAKDLLQNKKLLQIIQDGKPFRPLYTTIGKKAPEVFVKKALVAVFNYDNQPKTITLPLKARSLKIFLPINPLHCQSICLLPV